MGYYVNVESLPEIKLDKLEEFKNNIDKFYSDKKIVESGWLYGIIVLKDIDDGGLLTLTDYYTQTLESEEKKFMSLFAEYFKPNTYLSFSDNIEKSFWRYSVNNNNEIIEEIGVIKWLKK